MPSRLCLFLRQEEREDARESVRSSRSVSSTSTKSIPIHLNHDDVYEKWEIQEQEMIAEERDYIMFHRIVNGMMRNTRTRKSTESSSSAISIQSETDKSIASIMRTRYKQIGSDSSKNSDWFDYDDEGEKYNGRQDLNNVNTNVEDDRPPDAIFIIDM